MKKKKKILFVAFPHSIHAVRWIRQLKNTDWDVAIFPSVDVPDYHPEMPEVASPFISLYLLRNPRMAVRRYGGSFFLLNIFLFLLKWFMVVTSGDIRRRAGKRYLKTQLDMVLRFWRPDMVHSLETQSAGYLISEARKLNHARVPIWAHTTWGNDLYLWGRLSGHQQKVRETMSAIDYYFPENSRDIDLARSFGFKGFLFPIIHPAGGFNLEELCSQRMAQRTSTRQTILLKGYQGWGGRALVAIRALELCADLLGDFKVLVYSAREESVIVKAEMFSLSTGVEMRVLPIAMPHDEMLSYHAMARISLALSISDGVPSSLLEAALAGSFPIQSNTSAAGEWIVDGETGFIVPPEDPEKVAVAIRRALTDDALVDRAAELNWERNAERLDAKILAEKTIRLYTDILETGKTRHDDVQ